MLPTCLTQFIRRGGRHELGVGGGGFRYQNKEIHVAVVKIVKEGDGPHLPPLLLSRVLSIVRMTKSFLLLQLSLTLVVFGRNQL